MTGTLEISEEWLRAYKRAMKAYGMSRRRITGALRRCCECGFSRSVPWRGPVRTCDWNSREIIPAEEARSRRRGCGVTGRYWEDIPF